MNFNDPFEIGLVEVVESGKLALLRAAIPCGYPSGVMTTVNVHVLYVIAHSFLERTAPDSPLVKLLLRRIAHT